MPENTADLRLIIQASALDVFVEIPCLSRIKIRVFNGWACRDTEGYKRFGQVLAAYYRTDPDTMDLRAEDDDFLKHVKFFGYDDRKED